VVRDIPGLSMHRLVLCIAPDFREVPYASGLIVLQKIYDIIGRLSGIIRVSPMSVGPFANGRATDLWDLCINKLVNVAKQDHFDDRRFQLHAYEKDEFDRAKEHLSKLGTPGWCSSAAQVAAKG